MSKNTFKYVLVLLLLFLGFSNVNANSADLLHTSVCITAPKTTHNTPVALKPISHKKENHLVFETIEINEAEGDESFSKNYQPLQSFFTYFLGFISFNELYPSQKKITCHSKKYQDKSSTKLYIRFQVFII
ncbi:hypothetical protein BWZ22_06550 [Seonamhaeicola sp. S2-3]|uniref:hypothetical protein n=1 Tax=Seonamhaeicola sp. S2-3 TaxID=1936081 RepID=UPI000972AF7D|nr:hypothetical protein [Seonamhaeicola sp. S2-3]APY10919.1 hypothetical protein BWZ22_06550 [Seonamhaeicola sp. S2-3]